jgi:hypothetical protein
MSRPAKRRPFVLRETDVFDPVPVVINIARGAPGFRGLRNFLDLVEQVLFMVVGQA